MGFNINSRVRNDDDESANIIQHLAEAREEWGKSYRIWIRNQKVYSEGKLVAISYNVKWFHITMLHYSISTFMWIMKRFLMRFICVDIKLSTFELIKINRIGNILIMRYWNEISLHVNHLNIEPNCKHRRSNQSVKKIFFHISLHQLMYKFYLNNCTDSFRLQPRPLFVIIQIFSNPTSCAAPAGLLFMKLQSF